MTYHQTDLEAPGALFDAARSAEVVTARMGPDVNPRFREIMTVVVRHLHDAVKELSLTSDEWMRAIQFLTRVGHTCTDWRQEFILLSDTLGVSMLVDAINHDRPAGSTENTVLGPFYAPGAPPYANGQNICLDARGEPLFVRGTVFDQHGQPVPNATLEVWQANEEGFYDVQQKGVQPDWNLRGTFTSDAAGRYWFETIKPKFYPIPDDGPVGDMLKALGRHPNRAAHLHFIVTAEGFQRVVTHIFMPGCQYLGEDAVFGVKRTLIAELSPLPLAEITARGVEGLAWRVVWDFILAPEEKALTPDHQTEKH